MDKKDVIYVDIDEDITDIVGKIKKSAGTVIALVPPKRIGALNSIVNLKLLSKVAKTAGKHVVLVSSAQALVPLAAAAKLPLAKTLQSKPEIPVVAKLEADDGDTEIIEGEEIPVKDNTAVDDDVDEILLETVTVDDTADAASGTAAKKPKNKVPNFNKFRKKIFIAGAAALLLIAFIVWAVVFAPAATVYIKAQTAKLSISAPVQLVDQSQSADPADGILNVVKKEVTKSNNVTFTPTGSKDVGDKATGTITVSNCDYSDGFTLAVGTQFVSSDGLRFTSQAAVTVPKFTGSASSCSLTGSSAGKASVKVTAMDIGEEFNIAADSYQISGLTGKVGANGTAMSGGTKRTVTVVSQDDIDKAKTGLKDNNDAAGKRDLIKSFGDDYIAIEDSFTIDVQDPKSDPDIDKETTTTSATLTATTVYSGYGVNKSQVSKFLDAQAKDSIKNQADQKIYKNGLSGVSFEDFVGDSGKRSANIRATAQTGPNISEDDVKNAAKGQKYGEVKRLIGSINGVRDVDVKFSFFWVSTVPNDTSRIKVEFQLND